MVATNPKFLIFLAVITLLPHTPLCLYVGYSYEPTTSHWCSANMITPLPNPMYYAVACFNDGVPEKGFWVVEAGSDLNSASYKSFVQMKPTKTMVVTQDGLAVVNEEGEEFMSFSEVTFTGTTYTIGTIHTKDFPFFNGLSSSSPMTSVSEQFGSPYIIPGTNYAFVGLEDIPLGFRLSKNGDSMPTIDVYNSLYSSPNMVSLHKDMGNFLFSTDKSSPTKSQLFDHSVTGATQAIVTKTEVYFGQNPNSGIG